MRGLSLLLCLFFCGCMQMQMLPYLDQVMVLQDFGQDKKAQEDLIKRIDDNFDKMQKTITDGQMGKYKDEKAMIKAFGPPIIAEEEVVEGKVYKQALYRYAIMNKSSARVHIFYDQQGRVAKWEKTP